MTPLSIVVIHWNTPDLLDRQLALLTSTPPHFPITIVDNASEKSLDWVENKYRSVELIKNQTNRGYAFAANRGTLRAKGKWLLFLNPDVEITTRQIKQIIKEAEEKKLDACTPQTDDLYQRPLPTPFSLLTEFTPLKHIIPINIFKRKTLFGGCLLIKKSVFKAIGGWDERFFVWFEDSDLTVRLLEKNYQIGWVPVTINHRGGASFKNLPDQTKRDIFFHSMDVYAQKHFSLFGQLIVSLLQKRYSKRKLLPELTDGVALTIPNMRQELLQEFFKKNITTMRATFKVEWIVATSSIDRKALWRWRTQYPEVRFIPIENNRGFAKTVNIGLRASTTRWIGTINDDVILNKDWVSQSIACGKQDTGSINPVIYKANGIIESAGVDVFDYGKAAPKTEKPKNDSCLPVDAINAAAVLYSNQSLNIVGIFDERFESYLEDIDLSLRLRRAGFLNLVCPTATIVHKGRSTSTTLGVKKQWLDFRNWIFIITKNWGWGKTVLNFVPILVERGRNLSGILKKLF